MTKTHVPLNALRAFEVSARQLSFTRAGLELRVTQAAVSHQIKSARGDTRRAAVPPPAARPRLDG